MSSSNLLPICFDCARLRGVTPGVGWACEAYKGGIPTEILASRHDHHEPYEGDGGLMFEPKRVAEDWWEYQGENEGNFDSAKLAKEKVQYEPHAKDPNHRCELCQHFVTPRSCNLVEGDISPLGWCKMWEGMGAEDVKRIATDPPISEAQRRAMFAAASGHSNIGIPRSVGKEFAEADPGGRLPEKKKTAKDMTRSGWRRIYEGLSELARFFGEEEREPEHKGEGEGEDAFEETKHPRDKTGRFAYHGSPSKNFEKIKQEGLKPSVVSRVKDPIPRVHLTHEPRFASMYGDLYRVDKKHLDLNDYSRHSAVKHNIPPHHLEYLDKKDNLWKPLVRTKEGEDAAFRDAGGRIFTHGSSDAAPPYAGQPPFRATRTGQNPPKGRAASVAFVTPDGRVLMTRRSRDEKNYPGYWALPGGQVEDGENFAEAARRECGEEIGDCTFDGMVELRRTRTPGGFDHVTYTVPVKEEFKPKLNHEHDSWDWVPVTNLPEKTHPGVSAAIDEGLQLAQAAWIAREHGKIPGKDEIGPESAWYSKIVATDRGRRVFDRLQKDMAPEEFQELRDLLNEFFEEEEEEPEHHQEGEDAFEEGKHHRDKHGKFAVQAGYKEVAHTQEGQPWHWAKTYLSSKREGASHLVNVRHAGTPKQFHSTISYRPGGGITGTPTKKIGSYGSFEEAHNAALKDIGKDGIILDQSAIDPDRHVYDNMARDKLAHDYISFWPWSMATDRAPAAARVIDDSGHMHVKGSVLTKAVVSPYLGSEINAVMAGEPGWGPLEPDKKYYLLRDPDELKKAVSTFNGLPLLWRHQAATADDHPADIVIGSTGSSAKFEDPDLTNDLSIWPAYATKAVEDGSKKSLSCGYGYKAVMEPGVHEGQRFDGRMVDIKGNHVALVDAPRVPGAAVAGDSVDEFLWHQLADAIRALA